MALQLQGPAEASFSMLQMFTLAQQRSEVVEGFGVLRSKFGRLL